MDWIECIDKALQYIENHITEELSIKDIADHVGFSPFYFQKGFSMLCGLTIKEYIRKRRLSLAGDDLIFSNMKIIDIALKYGYDSPDSFTKAFIRFHGVTPRAVKKGAIIKTFAPLKINITLKGGYTMDYKIVKKESFTVLGSSKLFSYESPKTEVPQFWNEHYALGKGQYVKGVFGINIDEQMSGEQFEYMIADLYDPIADIPKGFITKTIPALTWAVFPCRGPLPQSLQDVNTKIFSEWLPALKEYEFACGYCIEMYDDPVKYPLKAQDENYYCEIWIPIKKKD